MDISPPHGPSPLKAWVRALESIRGLDAGHTDTLPARIDELSLACADAPALLTEQETVTYADLARRCRQYARWALRHGIGPGHVVGLLMRNCAEYPAIWLGITRVGGTVALLNTHLTGAALAHSLAVACPGHLIVEPLLVPTVEAIGRGLSASCRLWVAGAPETGNLDCSALDRTAYADGALTAAEQPPAGREAALLVFTSGTTGLPKAARISHRRVLEWGLWFAAMMGIGPSDRLYDCLPMYHSTGGVVAIGALLSSGGTVVVRDRFSATRFWPDVVQHGCTVFLYIGELCRYLLAAPGHPQERDHRLRLCVGNGLRGDVWERFAARFAVPRILEFYASTEGNVSLYNCEGRPGAIGRIPPFLAHRFPVALIACDPATGAPARGGNGLCIATPTGEVGEALGKIGTPGPSAFEGYTDPAATEGKVLRAVFEPGDAWFRTGDLMRRDAAGFFYFVDRIGDTYRWKGENVSTAAVCEAVRACPGVTDAVIYGVEVPGNDGRAGMAALTVNGEFDLASLQSSLDGSLPGYARPPFLRVCERLDATATFKPVKARLAHEGYDCRVVTDPLYVRDPVRGFVPLDAPTFDRLQQGSVRL